MAEKNGKKADKETKTKEETKKTEPKKSGQVNVYSKAEGKIFIIKETSLEKFLKTGIYEVK